MGKTKIPWATYTWNPVVGCRQISEGCKNCYAKAMSERFAGTWYKKADQELPKKPFDIRFLPDRLDIPLSVKKPSIFFVCSMGDLFHEDVQKEWHRRILNKIDDAAMSRGHKFLLLTKRPGNMVATLRDFYSKLPSYLWVGITTENQNWFDKRVGFFRGLPDWNDGLRRTFISVEPMLGPVEIVQKKDLISWVICGAETGPRKRFFNDVWGVELKDECKRHSIPFFFKKNFSGECKLYLKDAPQEFPDDLRLLSFGGSEKC